MQAEEAFTSAELISDMRKQQKQARAKQMASKKQAKGKQTSKAKTANHIEPTQGLNYCAQFLGVDVGLDLEMDELDDFESDSDMGSRNDDVMHEDEEAESDMSDLGDSEGSLYSG